MRVSEMYVPLYVKTPGIGSIAEGADKKQERGQQVLTITHRLNDTARRPG